MAAKLLAKAKTMLGRGYVADAGECLRKAFVYHPGDPEAARLEIAVRQEAERREERRVALVREMTSSEEWSDTRRVAYECRRRRRLRRLLIAYYILSDPSSRYQYHSSGAEGLAENFTRQALECGYALDPVFVPR